MCDPPDMRPRIEYESHTENAVHFAAMFPGLRANQPSDGQDAAIERVSLSTHHGTHLDAPWHYHATMIGG